MATQFYNRDATDHRVETSGLSYADTAGGRTRPPSPSYAEAADRKLPENRELQDAALLIFFGKFATLIDIFTIVNSLSSGTWEKYELDLICPLLTQWRNGKYHKVDRLLNSSLTTWEELMFILRGDLTVTLKIKSIHNCIRRIETLIKATEKLDTRFKKLDSHDFQTSYLLMQIYYLEFKLGGIQTSSWKDF